MIASTRNLHRTARRQRGAALVVGLMLLLVLTVLAISGMSTSSLELQMAGNTQYSADSFNFAEGGLEFGIKQPTPLPNHTTLATAALFQNSFTSPTNSAAGYTVRIDHNVNNGETIVPEGGDEIGGAGGITAYHYEITSSGRSSRNARSIHTHSYYRKGATTEQKF